jgi:hypothetical protein
MKMLPKKTLAAVIAGAFIIAGVLSPFIVQAATSQQDRSAVEHRQVDPDKAAQRIADNFGLDKDTVLKYHTNGIAFRDIGRAALLANAANKSIDEVIGLKTSSNTWKDVAKTLNVTKDQLKTARNTIAANRLNAKLGFDKDTVMNLFEQGYKTRDVAMAGLLAQDTGKTIATVLDMKKINNTWRDVANSLGVDNATQKQDMQKLQQAFPNYFHKHHK